MDQNIVIAIDHSIQSVHAVKYYLEKIHRKGNKVVLVHCIELPELSLIKARDSHMSPGVLANMWKEEEAKINSLEEKMGLLLREKEVPGVLRTVSGRPGEVLCQVSLEEKAVMVIAGCRGVSKMKRTILGSISDYLVSHAQCPVLVYKDESERKQRNSGDGGKLRHISGDSINSFASNLRQRFASGGKSRSQSASSEKEELTKSDRKENQDPKEGKQYDNVLISKDLNK